MTLPLFYEPDLSEHAGLIQLSEDTVRHCLQVLRMREGSSIEITNGRGLSATGTLLISSKKSAQATCTNFKHHNRSTTELTLCLSPLKNPQRLEWLLEKATEIGMQAFIPIICQRTEHSKFRKERLQGILVAAMLQSRQYFLPELHDPIPFHALMAMPALPQQWIAHCANGDKKVLALFQLQGKGRMLIGPEGDFTSEEINTAISHHYQPVSLGNTRLRTETAGLVAVTLLLQSSNI
jgi:16S rRNA (uracil1498-N3)-methyltransferase